MVAIEGLSGVPEPKSERPDKVRSERENAAKNAAAGSAGGVRKDDVAISEKAQAASEVGRVFQLTRSSEEIRTEKVEAAKQRIEQQQYKQREVVAQVAERLIKLLS